MSQLNDIKIATAVLRSDTRVMSNTAANFMFREAIYELTKLSLESRYENVPEREYRRRHKEIFDKLAGRA